MVMLTNIRPVLKVSFSYTLSPSCQSRRFSLSLISLYSQHYRVPTKYKKWKTVEIKALDESENIEQDEDVELDKLLKRSIKIPGSGHQVLVIQPYIKWGAQKKRNTTPELQLLEAVTLIKTLREWTVVDEMVVPLQCIRRKAVFGKGTLMTLKEKIAREPSITAVFMSLNTLTIVQQIELEKAFGVVVFDRYTIIINIFKEHARTKEAKLQIQLAQLPYLWSILRGVSSGLSEKLGVSGTFLGGQGPRLISDRKEVFKRRQAKLKKEILDLRKERSLLREKRDKQEIPVVAVIGYTNAGKTSLVKALTGKESLEPQDYLFATLDVTSHLGVLPSGLKAYFVDTLGFISDIPTYLIESFVATLEDAAHAQVIVHVRDISHPDTVAQNDNVIQTLQRLNIPEAVMTNIITVGNKMDLLEEKELKDYEDLICVSSTKLTGIEILRKELERKILKLSDMHRIMIKVETGGPEYHWLHEQATVVREIPDETNNQPPVCQEQNRTTVGRASALLYNLDSGEEAAITRLHDHTIHALRRQM